ncbi:MAG: hypothetical protein HQK66_07655 [Desulfamplus sp.]|nr:hypothetical protein [Desulfamplus sp.]
MKQIKILFLFFRLYSLVWKLLLPMLQLSPRLARGMTQRMGTAHLEKCDIWIQGASAGESYLTAALIKCLPENLEILATTTTQQGMEVLEKQYEGDPRVKIAWFPFDIPKLMDEVLVAIEPRLIVLMETELWPSLMASSLKHGCPVMVVNGRISSRSHRRYILTRIIWKQLNPHSILAVSTVDAGRFRDIFPKSAIDVMPNMKFDAILTAQGTGDDKPVSKGRTDDKPVSKGQTFDNSMEKCGLLPFPTRTAINGLSVPVSIFASIRKEEEKDILYIIPQVIKLFPNQTILIFPRHMHRMDAWKKGLSRIDNISWNLASSITALPGTGTMWPATGTILPGTGAILPGTGTILPGTGTILAGTGTIVLWDIFGDLKSAYCTARAAFVGGSLKPLGGHNFIEPLLSGTPTVTGPYIEDFSWVGEDIFTTEIIRKINSREELINAMVHYMEHPLERSRVKEKAMEVFIKSRGGTKTARDQIVRHLKSTRQ